MRRECREAFHRHRLQRKPLVSYPGMHHGTCVTHVPWSMSGSLTRGGGGNVPGIPSACATRNFTYLVRCPLAALYRFHSSCISKTLLPHQYETNLVANGGNADMECIPLTHYWWFIDPRKMFSTVRLVKLSVNVMTICYVFEPINDSSVQIKTTDEDNMPPPNLRPTLELPRDFPHLVGHCEWPHTYGRIELQRIIDIPRSYGETCIRRNDIRALFQYPIKRLIVRSR